MSCHAQADLTPQLQQNKIQGLVLYNQYKIATPELRIAAEAGDREAQFYLAEELRQQKQYITADAKKWYEAAAAQGDYYAMFKLATSKSDLCNTMNNCTKGTKNPGEWLEHLWKIAEPKANSGDGEAMYIMYLATTKLDWLEKSAVAGYAQGQWLLANRYKEGESFFYPGNVKKLLGNG
jgi:TPR repeat protein